MPDFTLGVLDQSPIREGGTAADAIHETLELARETERFGYERYWLAEHHNSGGLACASPEILITRVASVTSRIKVGSGGVMLSHYSALKVAEEFRMMETLFPGRIELGVGRAPGTDGQTAAALATGPGALGIEHYPQQVADLVRFLADEVPEEVARSPYARPVRAMPACEEMPEVWLLGSSLESAQMAAEQGLPFSFAHFISPEWAFEAVQHYRSLFRPSRWLAEPRINVGVSALCAETEEEAHRLAMSRYLWRLRNQLGNRGGVPSPETAGTVDYTEPERDFIEYQRGRGFVGDPQQVRRSLEELGEQLGTSDLVVVTITYAFEDRVRSYELLAQEFGIAGGNPTAAKRQASPSVEETADA